ncbi:prephenate dehydrogenase [Demetria terragena]|uniref:prephenate dehydrogenase n=1 Tax=Demetria terragena TaxID=63959 RepID=UPI00037CE12F|nr:prephenate dehydrogenase [Demetria terragena]
MTTIRVVGTGLLGTSIGMALSRRGHRVLLEDTSPTTLALARDLGAGEIHRDSEQPHLVVVATPPDVTAQVVARELQSWPEAIVTDVASVKQSVLDQLRLAADAASLTRYVGSHPMAGRERSGAVGAQDDLFEGRTWVLVPHESTLPAATALVRELGMATGASVVEMPAAEHDLAVAAVSHLPQVAASLVAARLRDLPDGAVALAGPGVRDVTRIAASDPLLWTQILSGNAVAITPLLGALSQDLANIQQALEALQPNGSEPGARGVLAQAIAQGQQGQARLPGKHGAAAATFASLVVVVPDEPGELGRLFTEMGKADVNLEDVRIEHAEGRPVGLAEVWVLPSALERLQEALSANGWSVHI